MRLIPEVLDKALDENKILPYEQELLTTLRTINFQGLPISIIILSNPLCRRECYTMSMNLTRGMDYFKLVHGNVNYFDKNNDCPNHSWVERDGFVYDTTDGLRWDKDLYYELFEPEVCEVYDENTVKDYEYYQNFLSTCEENFTVQKMALMIQYIELLEQENPCVNSNLLFEEIKIWRESNNITNKYSDETMKQYKKMIEEAAKKNGINI